MYSKAAALAAIEPFPQDNSKASKHELTVEFKQAVGLPAKSLSLMKCGDRFQLVSERIKEGKTEKVVHLNGLLARA